MWSVCHCTWDNEEGQEEDGCDASATPGQRNSVSTMSSSYPMHWPSRYNEAEHYS